MAYKHDLIEAVAQSTALSKKDSANAVDAILDSITESLAKGESVQLMGFGKFEVRHRNARTGRNPRTGEEIELPAHITPAFKAGKQLRDAIK